MEQQLGRKVVHIKSNAGWWCRVVVCRECACNVRTCEWLAGVATPGPLTQRLQRAARPPPHPPASLRVAAAGVAGREPHAAQAAAARAWEAPCALGRWVPGEREGGARGGRKKRGRKCGFREDGVGQGRGRESRAGSLGG